MAENQLKPDIEGMSALDKLVAKAEIYDVIMRYCRGVDRSDPELVKSVYHEDGYDDHGAMFQGPGWEFAKFFSAEDPPRGAGAVHFIGNHYVEFYRPDLAFSEAYYLTLSHTPVDDDTAGLFTFAGRYVDRFECRNGEWRVAYRICLHEWNNVQRFPTAPPNSVADFASQFVNGQSGPDDVVYHKEWLMQTGVRPGAKPSDPPIFTGKSPIQQSPSD